MTEAPTLADRLKKGLARMDQPAPGGCDAEALAPLRRSLERTLARLERGDAADTAPFRFQLTGGKPLLFHKTEALPLEPARLTQLLNSMDVVLESGESLELDGGLAAWLIRPEANMIDTQLRQADERLRAMKATRDRDHAATQAAESLKIRLRSRMTQLVGALQAAQQDSPTSP